MPTLRYISLATFGLAGCDAATKPDFPEPQQTNWPPSVIERDPSQPPVVSEGSPASRPNVLGPGGTTPTLPKPDSAKTIRETVKAYAPEVEACTQAVLSVDPSLSGRVGVGWEIVGGAVSGARLVSNTTGSDALGACVVRVVSRMRFPPDITVKVGEFPWTISGQ